MPGISSAIRITTHAVKYLFEYAAQDPEYDQYTESVEESLIGDVPEMENAVLAAVEYLNYVEEYAARSSRYQRHIDAFVLNGDAYYSLVAAENELLREFSP